MCVHSVLPRVVMIPLSVVLRLVGSLYCVARALSVRLNKFVFRGRADGQGWGCSCRSDSCILDSWILLR